MTASRQTTCLMSQEALLFNLKEHLTAWLPTPTPILRLAGCGCGFGDLHDGHQMIIGKARFSVYPVDFGWFFFVCCLCSCPAIEDARPEEPTSWKVCGFSHLRRRHVLSDRVQTHRRWFIVGSRFSRWQLCSTSFLWWMIYRKIGRPFSRKVYKKHLMCDVSVCVD